MVHASLYNSRAFMQAKMTRGHDFMMMMIVPNSHVRKGGKKRVDVKGGYDVILGEEEGNADYGGMVQPSQQHVAQYV